VERNSQFGNTERALTCSEFDALLSDALDGVLTPASQRRFDAHRETCATCGPLFAETSAGMNWLDALPQLEPPANLVHNILAVTSMQTAAGLINVPKLGWKERVRIFLTDIATPFRPLIREPRIAMTTAMAVFSIMLSLDVAGVRLNDLRHIDLRPSAIRQSATMKYTEASNRVIHYYYSIRLVYEVESRLQELKRVAGSSDEEQQQQQRRPNRDKTENEKNRDRKQNYYSMERQNVLVAKRSTNELKPGSTRETRASWKDIDADTNISNAKPFSSTELSRGLYPSGNSMRSVLA
jgi:putative zinc finger protein